MAPACRSTNPVPSRSRTAAEKSLFVEVDGSLRPIANLADDLGTVALTGDEHAQQGGWRCDRWPLAHGTFQPGLALLLVSVVLIRILVREGGLEAKHLERQGAFDGRLHGHGNVIRDDPSRRGLRWAWRVLPSSSALASHAGSSRVLSSSWEGMTTGTPSVAKSTRTVFFIVMILPPLASQKNLTTPLYYVWGCEAVNPVSVPR
jgi:hypothetical protein